MIEKPNLIELFPKIVLASASPRRATLLKQIGFEFDICPSRISETAILHVSPEIRVQELALMKARVVAERIKSGLIIGADTVIVINHQVIGKPENTQHAIEILMRLSGKCHEVFTGVALVNFEPRREIVWWQKTSVQFRRLHQPEILSYVDSGEGLGKAGAYGVQGRAAAFVQRIEGCYFNVVGLPLASLAEQLWELAHHHK